MDLSERWRFREVEKLLYNQLHEANEMSRIAQLSSLSQPEQSRASDAVQFALNRWNAFVDRREVPDDLKEWDGTGAPPAHRPSQ
jgi:hypothetical protein